jgi:predicted ATPase/DNA-binding SARP family transcriptional activator
VSAQAQPSSEAPTQIEGALEVRLLGPLEVRSGGEVLPLGGARQRALLALLCLDRGAVVSVDRIVDKLWGESPPATARHMVEVYVSKLRKLLGRDLLLTRAPGYLLGVDAENVDADRFERLLEEGRDALAHGDPGLAAHRLGDALALWRGPALADFTYEPFAQAEIARLEELRELTEEERIEALLDCGQSSEIVAEIEALVAAAPLSERRRAQLMLALYRAGRQADALAEYREAREHFVEELGVEPGPRLSDLQRAVLARQPGLDKAEPSGGSGRREGERRGMVTVLAAELAGPGDSREDPETLKDRLAESFRRAGEILGRYGAAADELPDGAFLAVFGAPVAHEDDVLRAVRAAGELRSCGVVSRAGIETGEALATPGGRVTGAVVRTASRLREAAGCGEIILGDAAQRLAADDARTEPAGRGSPVWRLLEAPAEAASRPLRLDAPLIGRERELAALRDAFEHAVEERRPGLITVLGEAGIGKTRLARELTRTMAGSTRVLTGRCLAYGEGITYWPLREIVRDAAGAETRDGLLRIFSDSGDANALADRLCGALGLAESSYPVEEVRWAASRLFEALAREQPLLVVVEDVHWAEPTFLDLLVHVAEAKAQVGMLVLCLARTEFLEVHPDWPGCNIVIEALGASESEELLALLAPELVEHRASRAAVLDAASGNPLFLEQLAALAAERSGWSRELEIPPTLQALLAARLDRLGPGERTVLGCAATVGREFWTRGVAELLPAEARASLRRHIEALARKAVLAREAKQTPFGERYRFRHVLIQEAAYRALPKERRIVLHERFAAWAETADAELAGEQDEIVGYHLERAYRARLDVALVGDETIVVGRRAGERLRAAGLRAFRRGDYTAAGNFLARAIDVLPADDPLRIEVLPWLGSTRFFQGRLDEAEAMLEEAIERARCTGDRRSEWRARLVQADLASHKDPKATSMEALRRQAEAAVRVLSELGDDEGLAQGWEAIGLALTGQFQYEAAIPAYEAALHHARRAAERMMEARVLARLSDVFVDGRTPVPKAIAQCEGLLARTQALGTLQSEKQIAADLAVLHAKQGRIEEAKQFVTRAHQITQELGSVTDLMTFSAFCSATISWAEGDLEAAEAELRTAYEVLEEMGEQGWRSTVATRLAELLYAQGRHDEAWDFAQRSEEVAAADDLASQVPLRSIRALVLADRGAFDAAESLAREAIALVDGTDDIESVADAHLTLASVLRKRDRMSEALLEAEEALTLSEEKANIPLERTARAMRDEIRIDLAIA